ERDRWVAGRPGRARASRPGGPPRGVPPLRCISPGDRHRIALHIARATVTSPLLPAFAFIAAALGAAALTPLAAKLATRLGHVSPPRVDRWGSRPTPLFGGVAI